MPANRDVISDVTATWRQMTIDEFSPNTRRSERLSSWTVKSKRPRILQLINCDHSVGVRKKYRCAASAVNYSKHCFVRVAVTNRRAYMLTHAIETCVWAHILRLSRTGWRTRWPHRRPQICLEATRVAASLCVAKVPTSGPFLTVF